MTFIYYQVVLFNPNIIKTLANATPNQGYDMINTDESFKTMISGKICFHLHTTQLCNGYVMKCHGMATAVSRLAVMVMKCEGETAWAKLVSTENSSKPEMKDESQMSGRK